MTHIINGNPIDTANPLAVSGAITSLPGTVAADITAIKTATELLDNAISGAEMQVDVITLPGTTQADIAALLAALQARLPAALGAGGGVKIDGTGTALAVTPGATEVHLGQVGGHTALADATVSMTNAAAYVAGDYVGVTSVPVTFPNCARKNGGSGVIVGAVLVDKAVQSISGELWLFDRSVTPPADSAAWSISDDDAAKCIGVIPFSTYYASALNSVSPVNNLNIAYRCAYDTTALYGCFVTRGAPTYTSGCLVVRLRILQD